MQPQFQHIFAPPHWILNAMIKAGPLNSHNIGAGKVAKELHLPRVPETTRAPGQL
jgi:hypothetical protein